MEDYPKSDEYALREAELAFKKDSLHLPPIRPVAARPEISIICLKCGEETKVRNLKDHQEFHNALEMFRYSVESKPTSVKHLLRRRRAIMHRLNETANSSHPVSTRKLHKLNHAYELLKNDIEGTSTTLRNMEDLFQIHRDLQGKGKTLSCALAFGVCQHANERWKTSMEDRYAFKDCFCNDPQSGFFAIYDGYSGSMAADKCARFLGDILEQKVEGIYHANSKRENVNSEISAAFNDAFAEMDKVLLYGIEEQSRNRWSGCSALTCLLRGNNLYVANAGNIRAVLCRGDGSIDRLSNNHSPRDKKERRRVLRAKGDICKSDKTALVNGVVQSTRGLGNHGDANLKSSVIRVPVVNCLTLEESDQFLILATNGVWEVFSEEEVILLLEDIIPDIDVKAIVMRMQERATARKEGFLVEKCDKIPRRDRGVVDNDMNHDRQTLKRGQKLLTNYQIDEQNNQEHVEGSEETDTELEETTDCTSSKLSRSRGSKLMRKEKATALAKALSERLVEGALLAGSHDNITVAVVLLNGCPLQLFLLPEI